MRFFFVRFLCDIKLLSINLFKLGNNLPIELYTCGYLATEEVCNHGYILLLSVDITAEDLLQ